MRSASHSPSVLAPLLVVAGALTLTAAALDGCASSQVELVGRARPAISPDQVHIYLEPPATRYEQIANLTATSSGSFSFTSDGKINKVLERLKNQAAKLGANGILLHGVGGQSAGSVGAGVSTEYDSGRSPYGLGFGVSAFMYKKSGDGVAIYVLPN
jgi:hypothetical protein